jgi:hypothetical protein
MGATLLFDPSVPVLMYTHAAPSSLSFSTPEYNRKSRLGDSLLVGTTDLPFLVS